MESSYTTLIDERYRVPNKDEKLHTKTLRTFFFMHSVGQLCRIRKTEQHQYPTSTSVSDSISEEESPQFEVILEGIFETCDA